MSEFALKDSNNNASNEHVIDHNHTLPTFAIDHKSQTYFFALILNYNRNAKLDLNQACN